MAGVVINGIAYDHGSLSVEIVALGEATGQMKAFTDLSYDDGVSRSKQRGAERVATVGTEGEYDANLSGSFLRTMFDALQGWFAGRSLPWYGTHFQTVVQYWNVGEPKHQDVIPDCQWQKRSFSSSSGTDPNKVAVEMFVLGTIFFDGVDGYGNKLSA